MNVNLFCCCVCLQLLNGKLCQQSSNMPSSPDTSSDSSTSSPHHPDYRASSDAENSLPGVVSCDVFYLSLDLVWLIFHCFQLMSQQAQYAQFFFQLADLGLALCHAPLRDAARSLLQLMPADTHTVEQLHRAFSPPSITESNGEVPSPTQAQACTVDNLFFTSSPSQVLYYLEVRHFFTPSSTAVMRPYPLKSPFSESPRWDYLTCLGFKTRQAILKLQKAVLWEYRTIW